MPNFDVDQLVVVRERKQKKMNEENEGMVVQDVPEGFFCAKFFRGEKVAFHVAIERAWIFKTAHIDMCCTVLAKLWYKHRRTMFKKVNHDALEDIFPIFMIMLQRMNVRVLLLMADTFDAFEGEKVFIEAGRRVCAFDAAAKLLQRF